jgi:hypothetical protein
VEVGLVVERAELGVVVALPDEPPSTQKFAFVLSEPDRQRVRRGQFVQLRDGKGEIIAVVQELFRANRYFERPEAVSEYEKSKASVTEHFPVEDWEHVVADCAILGAWREGRMNRSSYPPAPGARVEEIDRDLLKRFLGFDEKGLHVGHVLQHEDALAHLNLTRLFQKHLAILGTSGSGKSFCATGLIEELLDRPQGLGRLALVAIDSHGDYSSLGDKRVNAHYHEKTTVIDGARVRFAARKLSPGLIRELVPELSGVALRSLEKVMLSVRERAKGEQRGYDLKEVYEALAAADIKDNVKGPLLAALQEIRRLRLFAAVDHPALTGLVQPGKLLVFDLSDVDDLRRKQVITSVIARRLFKLRKDGKIPPFVFLVEEAHNFAPERAQRGTAIAKGIIEKLAREGRKFGASVTLVSQRPVHLSTTTLANANSFIIFRITNPYDLQHIGESCEAIDKGTLDQLTMLKVGECILLGECVNAPVFVKVRERKSRKGSRGEPLEEMARKYEELSAAVPKEDVAEAFLADG